MSRILCALALALLAAPAAAETSPYTIVDQVMLDRVSDPQLSPDGKLVAYQVRETNYEANKGVTGLWLVAVDAPLQPRRLTTQGTASSTPRWSPDGRSLYFLSGRAGSSQVWKLDLAGGEAQQVTNLPLDVGSYKLSPTGRQLAVTLEVFPDCRDLPCTKQRQDERAKDKKTGQLFHKLFIRHWDTWKDGTRSQLFVVDLDERGVAAGEPRHVSAGIDGDVPSKPFGDDTEYAFSPDGATLTFAVRIAGTSEPWSTNFDLWSAPVDGSAGPANLTAANPAWDTGPRYSPDGRWLAYLAMRRPGFEADRFAIMLRDLQTGTTREIAPRWDRSPASIAWSADGKTIYANAYDLGQKPLFAIDIASGKASNLTGKGTVAGFSVAGDAVAYTLDSLAAPADVHRLGLGDGRVTVLTRHNEERLAHRRLGVPEQFSFRGAGGDTVYGHVVRPADFEPGRKYPVAFIIHGGPQGSMGNSFHYRWNPQTYAGRGFAAVFIDFHGSTGYGQKFTDSISRDWGGKPLEDLRKGWAHALKAYPFLDGARACALGASYGGFMVNWIASQWPEAFQCLVNHDGVFDARMMYYSTEELWFDEWEHGGPQYQRAAEFEKFNPANHVAKWKKPMLVVHGALDYRITDDQGIATFTALQRRSVPSQFLYFPDENHWVLKPQNSVQWHETVEAWLKRWTGS